MVKLLQKLAGILAEAPPVADEARRGWRSGQNFRAAPRHREILGTARERGAAPLIFFSFYSAVIIFYVLLPWLLCCGFCFSADVTFSFYSPVRAALTFVGCDKSKQKRAFGPSWRAAVAVNFSASAVIITVISVISSHRFNSRTLY